MMKAPEQNKSDQVAINPLVTVYIPTFNRQRLLCRAIDSVLAQTYKNFEIIISNDGSTDGTREYLEALAAKCSNLKVIHFETSVGAPACRNRALAAASGEYVTGLDDDDEFRSDRLENFVNTWRNISSQNGGISCLFSDAVFADDKILWAVAGKKGVVNYLDLFEQNYVGNQVFCPRQFMLEIGGFDESLPAWQDLDTFIRLLKRFGPAIRVEAATYVYHVEPTRSRISKRSSAVRDANRIISKKYPDVDGRLIHSLFLQMFSSFYRVKPERKDFKQVMLPFRPRSAIKLIRALMR